MAKATSIGFNEEYGFMASSEEINDLYYNQGMFLDHVDYTEGFWKNAGTCAIGTKVVTHCGGESFRKAEETELAIKNYGCAFGEAKRTKYAIMNKVWTFENAEDTEFAIKNEGYAFREAIRTKVSIGNKKTTFIAAEKPKYWHRTLPKLTKKFSFLARTLF